MVICSGFGVVMIRYLASTLNRSSHPRENTVLDFFSGGERFCLGYLLSMTFCMNSSVVKDRDYHSLGDLKVFFSRSQRPSKLSPQSTGVELHPPGTA